MRPFASVIPCSLLAATLLTAMSLTGMLLTGCSTTFNPAPDAPVQTSIGNLSGSAYGGQQPIAGAKIYLFAAGTTAYAGPGIAASTSNASVSLLNSNVPAVCTAAGAQGGALPCKDASNNYYVFTDANGNFNIGGEYTCTSGKQVYMYAVGGNTGSGVNPYASLMAVLGNCPANGTLAQQTPHVYINEVTTVAAAYAFSGFASDAIHVSSGPSALAATGLKNAFANAAQMANIATPSGPNGVNNFGGALATTPGGNGTVPQKLLNTLANLLAGCVNTTGVTSACTTLFSDDRSGGGQTGTQAAETATAAIYLAQHPYSAYVTTLYNLIGSSAIPFTPALTAAPASFVVEILFSHASLSNGSAPQLIFQNLAVDASGNIWVANAATPSVSEFSPLGISLAGTSGFAPSSCGFNAGSGTVPVSVAVAISGYVWTGITNQNGVCVLNSAGAFVAHTTVSTSDGSSDGPYGIALDSSGNAWVTNDYGYLGGANAIGQLYELSGSNYSILKTISNSNGFDQPIGIAIASPTSFGTGHTGDIWVANISLGGYTSGDDSVFTATGANETFSPTNGGGNIIFGQGIAIDASGYVWTADSYDTGNAKGLAKTAYNGASSTYYAEGTGSSSLSIDGAGNVWSLNTLSTSNSSSTTVFEISNSGTLLTPAAGFIPITDTSATLLPLSIVVDGSGNVWYTMAESNTAGNAGLRELIGIATPVATPLAYGVTNNLLGSKP